MSQQIFKWITGRQNTGYEKFTLIFSKTLALDAYIIRIPMGVEVPTHTDTVTPNFSHHRVNITLRAARKGGLTYIEDNGKLIMAKWAYKFRPDIQPHRVTKVEEGELWILSFGWLTKDKNKDNQ